MKKLQQKWLVLLIIITITVSCSQEEEYTVITTTDEEIIDDINLERLTDFFGDNINLTSLDNYENQTIPTYIRKDNTRGNDITNEQATLGRVLFYDKNLSVNNTISCASCHQQAFAFGDPQVTSTGVNGLTGRHSMRLVNTRFDDEENFF